MPDLNFNNKELRNKIINYAKTYIKDYDIDGFRLDAAMHVYSYGEYKRGSLNPNDENIKLWKEFREELQKEKKDVYLVGETGLIEIQ